MIADVPLAVQAVHQFYFTIKIYYKTDKENECKMPALQY